MSAEITCRFAYFWGDNQSRLRSTPARLRLSNTVTTQPCSSNRLARLLPIKPAPPVISARMLVSYLVLPCSTLWTLVFSRPTDIYLPSVCQDGLSLQFL